MQTSNIPGLTLSVRVQLFVEHPINGELLILLENDSAYTLMTLSNGGTRSNVFNGTIFDDSAVFSVANYHFVQGVVAPVLRPLYSFTTAFSFLSPNSVWTLVVLESSLGSPGTLVRWVLDVNGLSGLPISPPVFCEASSLMSLSLPLVMPPCLTNPCVNGGKCFLGIDGNSVCDCPSGYYGPTCAIRMSSQLHSF